MTATKSLALVASALLVWSCTERTPLAPRVPARPEASLLDSLVQGGGLLTCTPLAADSATATIGPDGGTIQVGPHVFTVPAGALLTPVTITAVAPSDTVNRIVFQPQGLQFLQPATLTMSYGNCNLLGLALPPQVVYTDDALNILQYLWSIDDPQGQTVTARVHHFSEYAVAW